MTAEVFSIPVATGRYLVYAPLRRAAFIANATFVNFLDDLRHDRPLSGDQSEMTLLRFLRHLRIVDGGAERQPPGSITGPPRPTAATLLLTTACSLRCTYCYAAAGDAPARAMPLAVAERAIQFVARNAAALSRPSFQVSYHGGGEPTLNWQVLVRSAEYARRAATRLGLANPETALATNGVLDDEQLQWVINNIHHASISFDGLPHLHDRHRVTAQGSGSSERVLATLRRLDDSQVAYGIRMTATADTIPHLEESVAFICSRFRRAAIMVEPVYPLGRGRHAPAAETEAFTDAFRRARRCATAAHRLLRFSTARLDTLTSHFCGASQDGFSVTPEGRVSACYEVFSQEQPLANLFLYGRPSPGDEGFVFDATALARLRAWTVDRMAFCEGCFARWHCAGDCPYKAAEARRFRQRGSARCTITRELVTDQILAKIAASGGNYWLGATPPDETARAPREDGACP